MPVDWEKERSALGTETDAAIASRLGVSRERVRQMRLRFGIARAATAQRVWSSKEIAMLGKLPDKAVAKRLKVSVEEVLRQRHERGILPWRERGKNQSVQLTPEAAAIIDSHRRGSETRRACLHRLLKILK